MTDRALEDTLTSLRQLPVVREGFDFLRTHLSDDLTYHSVGHTEDVLRMAIHLAVVDRLSQRDIELLAVAAVMHDSGFVNKREHNEPQGAQHAREFMVRHGGYSEREIALVERMILDTALIPHDGSMKQIPNTSLSRYLLDADLANFGREDFLVKSDLLRQELKADQIRFQLDTLKLLESHSWLTPTAQRLWQAQKEKNIETLRAMIGSA